MNSDNLKSDDNENLINLKFGFEVARNEKTSKGPYRNSKATRATVVFVPRSEVGPSSRLALLTPGDGNARIQLTPCS